MTEKTMQVNLRVPGEIYDYLISLKNYSEYIRNLIHKDRLKKDPNYIDSEIIKMEAEIRELKALKKLSV